MGWSTNPYNWCWTYYGLNLRPTFFDLVCDIPHATPKQIYAYFEENKYIADAIIEMTNGMTPIQYKLRTSCAKRESSFLSEQEGVARKGGGE